MQYPIKRGDVYYAELDPVTGSEEGGRRPVIIIQNNAGSQVSPTVIVAPITCSRQPLRRFCWAVAGCSSS